MEAATVAVSGRTDAAAPADMVNVRGVDDELCCYLSKGRTVRATVGWWSGEMQKDTQAQEAEWLM